MTREHYFGTWLCMQYTLLVVWYNVELWPHQLIAELLILCFYVHGGTMSVHTFCLSQLCCYWVITAAWIMAAVIRVYGELLFLQYLSSVLWELFSFCFMPTSNCAGLLWWLLAHRTDWERNISLPLPSLDNMRYSRRVKIADKIQMRTVPMASVFHGTAEIDWCFFGRHEKFIAYNLTVETWETIKLSGLTP